MAGALSAGAICASKQSSPRWSVRSACGESTSSRIYKTLQYHTIHLYLIRTLMSIITEDGNRTNVYAKEPAMYVDPNKDFSVTHNEKAELINGRLSMLGIVAGAISYATTGKLFFGVF